MDVSGWVDGWAAATLFLEREVRAATTPFHFCHLRCKLTINSFDNAPTTNTLYQRRFSLYIKDPANEIVEVCLVIQCG